MKKKFDEFLEIEISRNGAPITIEIEKGPGEVLGLTFELFKYRCCGNKCIFCFVDQNPKNLRKSLYFKDEDERAIKTQQQLVDLEPTNGDYNNTLATYISYFRPGGELEIREQAYKNDPENVIPVTRHSY